MRFKTDIVNLALRTPISIFGPTQNWIMLYFGGHLLIIHAHLMWDKLPGLHKCGHGEQVPLLV